MDPLPRRAFLGVELPSKDAFTPDGMRVARASPGSMAEHAGLEPGDELVSLGGLPLRSIAELRDAVRRAGALREVRLVFNSATKSVRGASSVRVQHAPSESVSGHDVLYDDVTSLGARLRTIVTLPSSHARRPAVLFVQGIASESIDFGRTPDAPVCRLTHGWAGNAFVTMRLEKRGVGDSDGEVGDFETEVEDARVALRALASMPCVDSDAVFVFGHGVGGMVAPLLASEGLAAGCLVYGTAAARWRDCLESTARTQLRLRGSAAGEIDRRVARELEALGDDGGRSAAFHAQLHATDLAAAWKRVQSPVLVAHGEHDWVVGEDEQRRIVDLVNAAHPGVAELLRIPGLDHLMTRHASLSDSLRDYGRGAHESRLVDETSAWMRR